MREKNRQSPPLPSTSPARKRLRRPEQHTGMHAGAERFQLHLYHSDQGSRAPMRRQDSSYTFPFYPSAMLPTVPSCTLPLATSKRERT